MPENTVKKIEPMSVPADYASLGVVTGYDPVPANMLRQFIVGPYGEGKTSFEAGIPRTLIIDTEAGAWGVPRPRAHRIVAKTMERINAVFEQLWVDGPQKTRPYDRVVFDTVDQFAEILAKWMGAELTNPVEDIRRFGKDGAGYARLTDKIWSYIQKLESFGYAWTVVGHIQEKEIEVSGTKSTVQRPVIYKTCLHMLARNCDIFAQVKAGTEQVQTKVKIPGGRTIDGPDKTIQCYYLDVQTLASGNSTGHNKMRGVPNMQQRIKLPPLLGDEYGWDRFVKVYDEAVAEVKSKL